MDGKLQSARRGFKRVSHVAGNNVLSLVQQRERLSQAEGRESFQKKSLCPLRDVERGEGKKVQSCVRARGRGRQTGRQRQSLLRDAGVLPKDKQTCLRCHVRRLLPHSQLTPSPPPSSDLFLSQLELLVNENVRKPWRNRGEEEWRKKKS